MHSAKKAFSSLCIYMCPLFIIFDVFTVNILYFNEVCCLMPPVVGEGVNEVRGPLPMKLGQNKDGDQTPHQLINTIDFRSLSAVIAHFLKNTCLRTMECFHCELKAFSDWAHIYA